MAHQDASWEGQNGLGGDSQDWPRKTKKTDTKRPFCSIHVVTFHSELTHFSIGLFLKFHSPQEGHCLHGCCILSSTVELARRSWFKRLDLLLLSELNKAIMYWASVSQSTHFTEIRAIKSCTSLPKSSPLLSLNPFLDEVGLLRVGGRQQIDLSPTASHKKHVPSEQTTHPHRASASPGSCLQEASLLCCR